MYKRSAPKRTGIYRVSGNISEFQLELKLRHVSEWLPVPKFEYAGAKARNNDHYPESPGSGGWSDCFIYVPYEDQCGNNYYSYYNYYNPGSEYPGSSSRSRSCTSRTSGSGIASAPTASSNGPSLGERPASDAFHTLNPELCSGSTARLCISWQQKHFSRAELLRYGDASKCHTTLQRRYHRWTRSIAELQRRHQQRHEQRQRVRRRHKSKRRSEREQTTSPLPQSSLSELEPLQLPDDPNYAARTCLIHTLVDADLQLLEDADLPPEARQLHEAGCQVMYVYAQLQQDTLLLSLHYEPQQGLLYVYPDFSLAADDLDYVLQIDNDCRQLYAYGFQNVTPLPCAVHEPHLELHQQQQLPPDEALPSEEALPAPDASAEEVLAHYQKLRTGASELRRLLQFTLPPRRMRRVSLLLELREAQHFEYPNIHVRYYVNPPASTVLEPANANDPFPLRGATATCVSAGAARLAHFSHCWQLTLLCEESYEPQQLLHIYFEVISVDRWQRERCEGYAHFACSLLAPLPAAVVAGQRLHCIRPLGGWLDALNRYFIGGRALFDFVGYFNSGSRGSQLHSRLEPGRAQAMRSTGSLVFSVQKLQQRQLQYGEHLTAPDSDDDDADGDDDARPQPATSGSSTLNEVLAAYVEARERIESLLGHAAAL